MVSLVGEASKSAKINLTEWFLYAVDHHLGVYKPTPSRHLTVPTKPAGGITTVAKVVERLGGRWRCPLGRVQLSVSPGNLIPQAGRLEYRGRYSGSGKANPFF